MDFKVWVIFDGTNVHPEHSSQLPLACRSNKQLVGIWWDPIFKLQQLPWLSVLGVSVPLPITQGWRGYGSMAEEKSCIPSHPSVMSGPGTF